MIDPHTTRTWLAIALLAWVAWIAPACAAPIQDSADAVREDVYHGRYEKAVREASDLRAKHPGDPRLEALHRDATVAYLLEQGRRETFRDRDLEALGFFRRAQEVDPGSRETQAWMHKTLRKLSRTWLERGLELHASGKLEEAVAAYEQALEYVPGDPSALNGLGEAIVQINYREGMGKQYFEEGIRALSAYWLEQAKSRFAYSDKYEPDDQKTLQRASQVDVLLAQQRVTVAKGIEQDRRYAAARNEYRLAVALDPGNAEAKAGFERCTKETEAASLLEQARMEVVRSRLDRAGEHLQKGEALTTLQKDEFEGARAQVETARLDRKYQEALTLERDYQFENAIVKYGELLSETEYFKDAITRKETLEGYVRLAADLYQKAQAAATDQERIDALQQILVFWPEYKDVAAQLAKLEGAAKKP